MHRLTEDPCFVASEPLFEGTTRRLTRDPLCENGGNASTRRFAHLTEAMPRSGGHALPIEAPREQQTTISVLKYPFWSNFVFVLSFRFKRLSQAIDSTFYPMMASERRVCVMGRGRHPYRINHSGKILSSNRPDEVPMRT